MTLTTQEIEEQVAHERTVIRELVRRKRLLEIEAAKTGNSARPEVLNELSDLAAEIRTHEAKIIRLESLPTMGKKLRILYVEDFSEHAERYKKVLHAHFGVDYVKHVVTARKALSELYDHPPDVLVADLHIPPGPNYVIPVEAEGLPRIGGWYAYGADICAVALQRGIPVVALSTAPINNPVRAPIEQARRKYGGTVYHLYKKQIPDENQLISSILQSYNALSEADTLTKELRHWLEDEWLDAPDVSTRLAILNEVQMALGDASQPTIAAVQTSSIGASLRALLNTHIPSSEEERTVLEQIKQLFSNDSTNFTDTRVAPG